MSAMFIMIGASLIVAVGFLIAFIWSVKNGQYDDDYTPSVRILFENTVTKNKNTRHCEEQPSQGGCVTKQSLLLGKDCFIPLKNRDSQ